jgi:hypothetical protein
MQKLIFFQTKGIKFGKLSYVFRNFEEKKKPIKFEIHKRGVLNRKIGKN